MAQLFEFAVLYHPKETSDAQGNDTTPKDTMLVLPTAILAGSDREVGIIAARGIATEYLDKLDQVEIVIRPFA